MCCDLNMRSQARNMVAQLQTHLRSGQTKMTFETSGALIVVPTTPCYGAPLSHESAFDSVIERRTLTDG